MDALTERQRRELDYHEKRAEQHRHLLTQPMDWDVLNNPGRRWWNAYWSLWEYLLRQDLPGKRVLVVGCGYGEDALRLAKAGAVVSAFDLSGEAVSIARQRAEREGLSIDFGTMPAESMTYADGEFDLVLAVDIMHHVDIPKTMREIVRVSKRGALVVMDEIYSHSITDTIRRSALVERMLYPAMRRWIYGTDEPYITADERKLTERDVAAIRDELGRREMCRYFNAVVTRLIPDRFDLVGRVDRTALAAIGPVGALFAGRILFSGRVP